jgi:hypothetical protein
MDLTVRHERLDRCPEDEADRQVEDGADCWAEEGSDLQAVQEQKNRSLWER